MMNGRRINEAISFHGRFKIHLSEVVATGGSMDSRDPCLDAGCCALGHWLESEDDASLIGSSNGFASVKRLHEEFHHSADLIVHEARAGHAERAKALLKTDFGVRSRNLVVSLMKWRDELNDLASRTPPNMPPEEHAERLEEHDALTID